MPSPLSDAEKIRLCAERIMGAAGPERSAIPRLKGHTDTWRVAGRYLLIHSEDSPHIEKIEGWNPLSSIADAMGLVDAMEQRGYILHSLERRFESKPNGEVWTHAVKDWKCVLRAMDYRNEHSVFLPFGESADRCRAIVEVCLKAAGAL